MTTIFDPRPREGMPTPWGRADQQTRIRPGVYEVSTPGHGGILVGQAVAQRSLSVEALSIGDPFGRFLAFEEDCAFAAVYADRPDWYRAACEAGVFDDYAAAQAAAERGEFYPNRAATDEQIRAYFLEIVVRWYADRYRFRLVCPECACRGQLRPHSDERHQVCLCCGRLFTPAQVAARAAA